MDSISEQARAAMQAIAGTVTDAPPLRLTPSTPPARRRRDEGWLGKPADPSRNGRLDRARWLVPLAAGVAVIAIAAGLAVAHRGMGAPTAPTQVPISAAGLPAYYVALSHPPDAATPNVAIVGDALTGQVLTRVSPPKNGTTFAGVAGAADDRTFVLETQPFPQPFPQPLPAEGPADPWITGDGYTAAAGAYTLPRTWYLLRILQSHAVVLTPLTVPLTPAGQEVTALALSPDGSKLALAILPHPFAKGYLGVDGTLQLLRVYSVATGAVLRTWSTTKASIDSYDYTPDSGTTMSWLPDGNHLAVFVNSDSPGLHVLDIRSPGGDLATAGARLTRGDISNCTPNPTYSSPMLLTPDGTTLVCGWAETTGFSGSFARANDCPATTVLAGIADYSLSAPAAAAAASAARQMWQPWRASRTLVSYRVPGHCAPSVLPQLAWSSPNGDDVVAYLASPGPGWAVYRPGGFTRLHVTSVPDPHYVAW
jgi:hypothetical protein